MSESIIDQEEYFWDTYKPELNKFYGGPDDCPFGGCMYETFSPEVDSDIYQNIKKQLLGILEGQIGLGRIADKAFSLPGKNGKTKFKIVPKI